MYLSIYNDDDRASLEAKGYCWALVNPRGPSKGHIVSKHRSYEAAERAAHSRELAIKDLRERHL